MEGPALRVVLELPERAEPGRPLSVRLVVENTTDEPVSVVSPSTPSALTLVVLDQHWNVVEPEAAAKVHSAREETDLAPGASQAWDLAGLSFVSGTAEMRYSLPPGTYHLLAVYRSGTNQIGAVSQVERLELAEPQT